MLWYFDWIGCLPILSSRSWVSVQSLATLDQPLFHRLSILKFMPLPFNYHDIISCSPGFLPKEFNTLLLSSYMPSSSFSTGGSNTQLVCWHRLVLAWASRLLNCQEFCQLECVHHESQCALPQVFFESQLLNIDQLTAATVSHFPHFLEETDFQLKSPWSWWHSTFSTQGVFGWTGG